MRIIVGITGATGAPLAVTLLRKLAEIPHVETHLIVSRWGKTTIEHETGLHLNEVKALADVCHSSGDQAATLSSGSFVTDGMIIIPCSMKTLAGIRSGYAEGLIGRAADVVLKEQRKLVLCVRETPLHVGHLRMMTTAAELGAIIMPPVPAFYHRPENIGQLVDQTVNRVIDQFDIELPEDLFARWQGA